MENFPIKPAFDRLQFISDINRAKSNVIGKDPQQTYLRERGIRYVIDAPLNMRLEDVAVRIQESLYEEFIVEPLFEDYENSPVPEKLRGFFLASLSGVTFEELSQSPYEAAYHLLANTPFYTVEPDLPYSQFMGSGASSKNLGSAAAPVDKAWSLRNMRVDNAWTISAPVGQQNGKGISIAHLDTGWTDHQDLDQVNFDHGRSVDFIDTNSNAKDPLNYLGNPGHGTKTGSVIMSRGGVSSNPPGTTAPGQVTGVAREVTYVPVRCITSVVIIFNSEVARAIRYAVATHCDVISMSLGGRPMKALRLALEHATDNDLLVVCAAGNNVRLVVWPARYPEAIAVAGSNCNDQPWSGSSRGRRVDISAPGENVWHADPQPHAPPGQSGTVVTPGNGTSYATANLAGVAALWLAFHGKTNLRAIAHRNGGNLQELFRSAVKNSARHPRYWDTNKFGAGIVQADQLLTQSPVAVCSSIRFRSIVASRSGPFKSGQDYFTNGRDDFDRMMRRITNSISSNTGMAGHAVMELFGNEIANVVLDTLDDIEIQSAKGYSFKVEILKIFKKDASDTLLKFAGHKY